MYLNKNHMKTDNVFLERETCFKEPAIEHNAHIKQYSRFLEPQKDINALKAGEIFTKQIQNNFIADFEKNEEFVNKNGGTIDLMCHVSTFYKIRGKIYMTYYANELNEKEDPSCQSARLAYCNENNVIKMTILNISEIGDVIGDKKTVGIYDTVMMYGGGDIIYLLWTASLDGEYYRLYRTFNINTETFGEIGVNRLLVRNFLTDFSVKGIKKGFYENKIPIKEMFSDIGIMQKLSTRIEDGVKYFYTGAYSGFFNFIIKSKDFITWEYVAKPDFINFSEWENATYVLNDKSYYFVRQVECDQGFLTTYDLRSGTWETPCLISDCQSRADFFFYNNNLYLVNAPKSRECIAITLINQKDISKSKPVLFCNLKSSIFYPFTQVYGDELFISYTVSRKHIRLTQVHLKNFL